jgi:hypothetical protein
MSTAVIVVRILSTRCTAPAVLLVLFQTGWLEMVPAGDRGIRDAKHQGCEASRMRSIKDA